MTEKTKIAPKSVTKIVPKIPEKSKTFNSKGVELIISEKPKAAQKIAEALADGKVNKKSVNGVPYYEIRHSGKSIIVASTVGHLFGISESEGKKWTYPVFDVEWRPNYETRKGDYSKKYFSVLKTLSKEADEFTVACDYDIEGEVIGVNIIRYICKKKDANRMKFSTLTKPDIEEAYLHKASTIDWGQAEAGLTRHEMDWYYGINISRALTQAIKTTGAWKILSSGRVQGPALKIIVDKEKEIQAFVPTPYWEIELLGSVKKGDLTAYHIHGKFEKKEEADIVMKTVQGKKAIVDSVERTEENRIAPTPFDLTTLQTEAYRCFGIRPKDTLAIGQNLYTEGLISYPRTSSQQLPPAIGFKKLISELTKQEKHKQAATEILRKEKLIPRNGSKTDPAHPAIYPTGQFPKKLHERDAKVYDLIVRRFLATFGDVCVRETMTIKIDVNKEMFVAKGTRTKVQGWLAQYLPYNPYKDQELPNTEKGEEVIVKKIEMLAKQTQPPRRYTQSSIIKELEKRGLGTKSTRAAIVDTLYQRNYVTGESIQATGLGISTVDTLQKYIPEILDEELTRHFESEMEEIRERKKKSGAVLEEVKIELTKVLGKFKKKEKIIGEELQTATVETRDELNTIGKCPNCAEGTLMMRKGKFGKFIACEKYPECKTTFKVPSSGLVKKSEKECAECKHPMILIIRKAKRPQEVCINSECASKKMSAEDTKIAEGLEGKKCSKCGLGQMVLRKSMYGSFMACNKYPKCRNIERLDKKYGSSAKKTGASSEKVEASTGKDELGGKKVSVTRKKSGKK